MRAVKLSCAQERAIRDCFTHGFITRGKPDVLINKARKATIYALHEMGLIKLEGEVYVLTPNGKSEAEVLAYKSYRPEEVFFR